MMGFKPILPLKIIIVFLLLLFFIGSLSTRAYSYDWRTVEAMENERIEIYKNFVRREDDTLYLKTKSGGEIILKKASECEPLIPCSYRFVDYLQDVGFYVIYEYYYEASNNTIISDWDGTRYSVNEFPIVSPDKKRIAAVSASDGFNIDGLFIWRIEGTKLVSELNFAPKEYPPLYFFKRWKDNSTIEIMKGIHSSKVFCPDSNFMKIPVTVKLEPDGWKFYEDLSANSVMCGDK